MLKMTPEEKAIKAWKRSTIALSQEVVCMKTRQDDLGANKTVATINTDLSVFETCWLEMKKDYIELDDNYPEPEVDKAGELLLATREPEYQQVESEYRDQTHELFITRENLMAKGNAPAEDVPAGVQLTNSTKKKRDKLVISMRTQLAQLQDNIGRLPPGSMARIQALEGEST